MEVETVIKIISAIVAIFSIGKIIYDITTGKKSRLREDYKFAKEFLEDLNNNPKLHPFAVERGYQALAGSTSISSEKIAYLLSLKNPGKCLNDYMLSKKYLQLISINGDPCLTFAKKYSSSWSRLWRKVIYFLLYVFCAVIAIIPTLFLPKYLSFLFTTTPVFSYWAVFSLISYIEIDRGEKLVNHQQIHTHMILIPATNNHSFK